MTGLSEQQRQFVDEHLKLREKNGKAAAIAAGDSEKTAASQASRLLTNVNVQKYLQQRKNQLRKDLQREFVYDAIQARKVMYGIMKDECSQDADRLRAARAFLELAGFNEPIQEQDDAPADMDFSDVTIEELRKLARLVPDD